MTIKEIHESTFDDFSKKHILKNYFQTSAYAKVVNKNIFQTMYIGFYDEEILKGAALILYKNIAPTIKYGYSPRGFLIDYYDREFLIEASKKLKEFFSKKGFAFIKINPEITYSILDFNKKDKYINNKNKDLLGIMEVLGYKKLTDNIYFESMLPKYNPIINLTSYDMSKLNEYLENNFSNIEINSLKVKIGDSKDLDILLSFINDNKDKYKRYYEVFSEKDMIDLFLIEIDYNEYSKALQREYYKEHKNNIKINEEFSRNISDNDLYNMKMDSDKKLNDINVKISEINKIIQNGTINDILAGALIIKYEGRINIILTGIKKQEEFLNLNFYLHYKIIEYYKEQNYKFIDLNGMTGDFSEDNPFKSLNDFKLQFNPTVYEYIGELDLIINSPYYKILLNTNLLKKEFNKEEIK